MEPVARLLAASGLPAAEARALLAELLGVTRETLIAHPELAVGSNGAVRFADLARQRRAGVPLAYLLGYREFYGRRFAVSPAVLVPRPETELLIDLIREHSLPHEGLKILDLGTGSGCLAITLALELRAADVTAADVSPEALAVATENGRALGASIRWIVSDWTRQLPADARGFDVIVANPPYIARGDPHLPALRDEPAGALVAGEDGLDDLRAIVAQAPDRLAAGGLLALEHGATQGAAVRALAAAAGLARIETRRDGAGLERACLAWQSDVNLRSTPVGVPR
jgi:release factor glutamine methyltransferase